MADQDKDHSSVKSELIIKKPSGAEVIVEVTSSSIILGSEYVWTYKGRLKED